MQKLFFRFIVMLFSVLSCNFIYAQESDEKSSEKNFMNSTMSGYYKTRHIQTEPVTDVYSKVILSIDSDTSCSNLTKKILVKCSDSHCKKAIKRELRKAKHHKFKLTKKNSSDKYAVISVYFVKIAIPEKKSVLENNLSVIVDTDFNNIRNCTRSFEYMLENGEWKQTSYFHRILEEQSNSNK